MPCGLKKMAVKKLYAAPRQTLKAAGLKRLKAMPKKSIRRK